MDKEKAKELIEWLYKELELVCKEMKEARLLKKYTSEAQHEGRADAILRMIKKIQNSV